MKSKIELVQFNIGFIKHNEDLSRTFMIIGEHDVTNLDTTSIEDFALYIKTLQERLTNDMRYVVDREDDITKLKELNLKTIDTIQFKRRSTVWDNIFMTNIGGVALLSVYNPKLYMQIIHFIETHDGTAKPLLDFGRESREGVSVLEKYRDIVVNTILPKFAIANVKACIKEIKYPVILRWPSINIFSE